MAAPLGEKERAAAFAAAHPLACIDLCPPVIASVPAPETIFGYDCNTKNSYMLRVVHRGYMKEKSTWYGKRAEFVQHGQLALLKQAFPSFFRLLPVGLHLTAGVMCTSKLLLVPRPKHWRSGHGVLNCRQPPSL